MHLSKSSDSAIPPLWIVKRWYSLTDEKDEQNVACTMESYSALKESEIVIHVTR